jgi:hypothetical protein
MSTINNIIHYKIICLKELKTKIYVSVVSITLTTSIGRCITHSSHKTSKEEESMSNKVRIHLLNKLLYNFIYRLLVNFL